MFHQPEEPVRPHWGPIVKRVCVDVTTVRWCLCVFKLFVCIESEIKSKFAADGENKLGIVWDENQTLCLIVFLLCVVVK